MVLTPASSAMRLEAILSPIAVIARTPGPMKVIPASARASAKAAFSDRKP